MKKYVLCVNLFCDCGRAYEDYPDRRTALKMRKNLCPSCEPHSYYWCVFYRMEE